MCIAHVLMKASLTPGAGTLVTPRSNARPPIIDVFIQMMVMLLLWSVMSILAVAFVALVMIAIIVAVMAVMAIIAAVMAMIAIILLVMAVMAIKSTLILRRNKSISQRAAMVSVITIVGKA